MQYWDEVYSQQSSFSGSDGWLLRHRSVFSVGAAVLDLGCGSGANIPDLLSLGLQVTAADLSPLAIQAIKSRFPAVHALCADMTQPLPFPCKSFSAVIADLSLHYFDLKTTMRIISEISRILAPGGALLARVHSISNIDPSLYESLEPDYYVVGGYPRRYFRQEQLFDLFSGWKLQAVPGQIERYGMKKQIFEILAVKPI